MLDLDITLEDKFTREEGQIYLSGCQALVRLALEQSRQDARNGLNTAGFISGYRGSPLGMLDFELWRARTHLEAQGIVFQPGLNEDLAMTAVWGSQQTNYFPGARHDGVFGMWYGKTPGIDRSGDALKHGNYAGSAANGGVLVLAGDDHAAKSTSTTSQSEYAFMDAMVPVLAPADTQEFIDMGLAGFALSRYSGNWIGFKMTATNLDASGTVQVTSARDQFKIPNLELPPDGLNCRWPDDRIPQEPRLRYHRIPAAKAFVRTNGIDRTIFDTTDARLGIVTAGKSWVDTEKALHDLGIDEAAARRYGLRVYKVGMTWPLEEQGILRFARGLEEILVVEEKRGLMEDQIKTILYDRGGAVRPRVIGKFDGEGGHLLPAVLDLDPHKIATVIGQRLMRYVTDRDLLAGVAELETRRPGAEANEALLMRTPYFCSGCPHNTSTVVPEGSVALGGIGCHGLAAMPFFGGRAQTFSHMGAEGATWIGLAPFTDMNHVFQNIGDGTYYHSGTLAIRAAIAAGVNMTYKLLFNDAVAMTGGQPVEGQPTPAQITRQLAAEGARQIVVVSDEPDKYHWREQFAAGVTFRHRDELDMVQQELRQVPGVTILLYDQTCAAEKRRRRKRGTYPDPSRRVVINELVCEGCGDCGQQSNCVSLIPVETEFGTKRQIDQSSCNKDFSCLKGFCPSFVTVEGGQLRKRKGVKDDFDPANLPAPVLPPLDRPWPILITGIGGTGVVTIGQILGMAAHIEGKGATVADITGLSQKGGSVLSQVTIAKNREALTAAQIAVGETRALIAADMVTAAMPDGLKKLHPGRTAGIVNTQQVQIGEFTRNPDMHFPEEEMRDAITARTDPERTDFLNASQIALALVGDTIATNMFMAGYAWQKGLIPLSAEAIDQAIELNGAAVASNRKAFNWGRRAAHEPETVSELLDDLEGAVLERRPETLDQLIDHRARFLTDYQNAAWAERYRETVGQVRERDEAAPGRMALSDAVARNLFKLMSYKDEYEVARLYTATDFRARLARQFEGDVKIRFHMAPPAFARRDLHTGRLKKQIFKGWWVWPAMGLLRRMKVLRGGRFDLFGRTAERRMERQLITDYEALLAEVTEGLTADNYDLAVALARVPEMVRGFGHVKEANVATAKARQAELLALFRAPPETRPAAE